MNGDTTYKIRSVDSKIISFKPLLEETWPSEEDLGLNKSQYEAYKLALTHEFAVVQGPPGTGKTFLGVKVANTLLRNLIPGDNTTLMLIICYTNHALDQFLEAILPFAPSMARIGGRSRNEALEAININKLRLNAGKKSKETNRLYYEQMQNVKVAIKKLQDAQKRLDCLKEGVLSYNSLKDLVPEVRILGEYYAAHRNAINTDPLRHWLFENMVQVDFESILEVDNENQDTAEQYVGDFDINNYEDQLRTDFILDEFDDDSDEEIVDFLFDDRIKTSFSVEETEKKLNAAIIVYKKMGNDNLPNQQKLRREIIDLKSHLIHFNVRNNYTLLYYILDKYDIVNCS